MRNIFFVFAVGIEAKFITYAFIDLWAEKMISQLLSPRSWLFDLVLAKNEGAALEVFRDNIFLGLESSDIEQFGVTRNHEYAKLLLGFSYLAHLEHKITYERMIVQVTDVLDLYGFEDWDMEKFVNKVPEGDSLFALDSSVKQLLLSCSECAKREFLYLQSSEMLRDQIKVLVV